jgi:phage baseplate assembly protein gpV
MSCLCGGKAGRRIPVVDGVLMDRLINALKLHADGAAQNSAHMRMGIITSYDPVNNAAIVTIQPEGVLSGWLPVGTIGVGASSMVVGPQIGDQVVLHPQEGDAEQWNIGHRVFDAQSMPPTAVGTGKQVQSGEIAAFHSSGSYFHLSNDGNVWLQAHGLLNVTAPTTVMTGDLHVTGTVISGYGGSDQVGLQTHTHHQPNDSHGDVEAPTNAPTAGT